MIVTHGETQVDRLHQQLRRRGSSSIVSKSVVGTGSGPFTFTVVVHGSTRSPSARARAVHAQRRPEQVASPNIPDGSTCTVTETDSRGATRSYIETSGTPNDGVVVIPPGTASAVVGVTNTFVAPPRPPDVVAPIAIQPRTVG